MRTILLLKKLKTGDLLKRKKVFAVIFYRKDL